ncbi:MAG TPA: AAA family ATPase, partial [Gemmatimonas sp.]|uniref:AAA family ATPase n=1 Tax=Gemmatimonas sp. TaxID=1962908 RepID=UPI002ED962DE
MRIAVCGSHGTGKSTLVAELGHRLAGHVVFDEPYYLLEEEGHAFAHPPGAADYELLLERSVTLLQQERSRDAIFDRGPVDYLAYSSALLRGASMPDLVRDTATAMQSLDLVVFVPIEEPDRMSPMDLPKLRRRVDRLLREMVVEQTWGFEVPVLVVRGTIEQRADQVMGWVVGGAR